MSPRKAVELKILSTPSALDAVKLMIAKKVGSIILVDLEGAPVGIITERDILKKVLGRNKHPDDVPAQEIMSHPLVTIKTYDSIETAAALMKKRRIKRLVVLEQDKSLAGVISITDIARKLATILSTDYKRYGRFKAAMKEE